MAGKRHSGIMDHKIYNKMPRMETAPQHCISAGKTVPKDVQVCNNLTYPLTSTESQHSIHPWSTATAYLQYAGNALNQHFQSGGVSKCQRPENEPINNPLQLSDNSSSHFSAQRHPVNNYHMSPSRAYPQIAVPRPVYRSPSSFIDPAYQPRDFQAMGVHVGSQTLCPPAMEWNIPTRFPYSSSPLYMSGVKNLHPAHNGYLEATGSPTSHSRSVQEPGPVHRHRTDINTSVGNSPSCYQEDVFTDRMHSYAQHNMQLLCAEGSVSVGKSRNSAFTTPTHEHYKCFAYQGSPDTRMGHMYSKAYYDSAMDSYHQRSTFYTCSVDKSISPFSTKGPTNYGKAQKFHSGYVNPEPRMRPHTNDDCTQKSKDHSELELQFSSTSSTNSETEMSLGKRDKVSMFGPAPLNRDFCMNSANMDKEHALSLDRMRNDLRERALYGKCITNQTSRDAFLQQTSSSKISAFPTKDIVANEPVKETSLTSKLSSSPNSLRTLDDRGSSNATFNQQTVPNHSRATDTVCASSTMLNPCVSFRSLHQHQMSNNSNQTPSHEAKVIQTPPRASKVDADGSKSPPMPVINDVFSLAPYRAYLEGKAPHPFPVHEESEVENNISTSFFTQQPSPSEKPKEVEKDALNTVAAVVNTEIHDSENTQHKAYAQTEVSQDTHFSNNTMDAEILDLSVKRSSKTSCSTHDQVNMSHSSSKSSPKLFTERTLSRVSEDMSIKNQESCLSQVTREMPHSDKELYRSRTTQITSSSSMENSPSRATEKTSHLAQESNTIAKTYICRSQDSCPSPAPEIRVQENQRSPELCSGAWEATQSLANGKHAKHSLHVTKNLLSPLHKDYSYQAIKSQPIYFTEKCKSQVTKKQTQQLERNSTTQALKNYKLETIPQARNNCPSRTGESKPDQLFESYQCYATKYPSLQTAETHPHSLLQETHASQVAEPPQLQQNRSSQNIETVPRHSYYKCITEPSKTYTIPSSTQSSNLPLLVNTIQTPTTFLPQAIIYSAPVAVFCPKNLNLPSHQLKNQPIKLTERRTRKSVASCRSEASPSGSENEGAGFQSSKAFMLRKYKMMKFSNSGQDVLEASSNSASHTFPRTFLLPSDAAQSLPPSAPESSPTLGEANVSLASADEPASNGSGQHFSELHRLVRMAVTSSVARSPSSLLENWLEKTKDAERSKTPVKAKSGSRPNDPSPESPCHDIWQDFDGVRLRLHKLLSQLETYMFTRSCPFPHVIRAGAIFIPIYQVKEVLFPELGTSVDRVLQKHKVELRPTTLSEEKLLRETELKDCSSRMLKLLALKQLPDVYPDLLYLFCELAIQNHLDSRSKKDSDKSECRAPSPLKELETASPSKSKASLVRLQQVCKSPRHVYKALQLKTLVKRGTEKLQTSKVCRKKSYRDRTLITYKRRRRVRSAKSKGFPELVGKRILHLFDDGECETWFPGRVLRVHRRSHNPRDTQYEVWYDGEPGTRYFLELLQDYEKGWLKLDRSP